MPYRLWRAPPKVSLGRLVHHWRMGFQPWGCPSADNIAGKAPSVETVVVPLLSARQFNLAIGGPSKPRGPNRLVLNSPVKSMK